MTHAKIASLQRSAISYPYNGAFDNGDTQYPQLATYATYGGLPLGLWPDYSNNPLRLKKFQPNAGDNLTKVWGKHTVEVGIFSQRTTNNQTATNPSTNGAIQDLLLQRQAVTSPTTTVSTPTVRQPTETRTSIAATR